MREVARLINRIDDLRLRLPIHGDDSDEVKTAVVEIFTSYVKWISFARYPTDEFALIGLKWTQESLQLHWPGYEQSPYYFAVLAALTDFFRVNHFID